MLVRFSACALLVGVAACGPDDPPENPDWSRVEPILRAECGNCHGPTAAVTGNNYRFDFYDGASDPCGDAAAVLDGSGSARSQRKDIATAITTLDPKVRPMMPPLPAPYLSDNEWLTILRWTANPIKGDKPANNQPPHISIAGTSLNGDGTLDLQVVVTDPEGDPVVGAIKIGDQVVGRMDRSGAFSATYDTSTWPAGAITMRALLCDGWSLVSTDLIELSIAH